MDFAVMDFIWIIFIECQQGVFTHILFTKFCFYFFHERSFLSMETTLITVRAEGQVLTSLQGLSYCIIHRQYTKYLIHFSSHKTPH